MKASTPATSALERMSIPYQLHPYPHHPSADSYGEEAAAALGIEPARIFKTLIATADGALICALVPVSARLNLKALAATVNAKKAELAEPAKAQRFTGYVVGGISPLGHRSRMPVVLDSSATSLASMFVSAGKRGLQLELAPRDLIVCTCAEVADIAAG